MAGYLLCLVSTVTTTTLILWIGHTADLEGISFKHFFVQKKQLRIRVTVLPRIKQTNKQTGCYIAKKGRRFVGKKFSNFSQ